MTGLWSSPHAGGVVSTDCPVPLKLSTIRCIGPCAWAHREFRRTTGGNPMLKRFASLRVLLLVTAAVLVYSSGPAGQARASSCIPDGGIDDTLGETDCCSGVAVPGSTWCDDPADFGTTWASCRQICAFWPPPDCDQFDFGNCDYAWDSTSQCCLAPPYGKNFCRDACY